MAPEPAGGRLPDCFFEHAGAGCGNVLFGGGGWVGPDWQVVHRIKSAPATLDVKIHDWKPESPRQKICSGQKSGFDA
jgi:hypothetical protein